MREERVGGEARDVVIDGLKLGIVLFILGEVLFFVSFFWCYFHVAMSELGNL